jgi:hypothetical protein
MKTNLSLSALFFLLLLAVGCSEEKVEPVAPEDDLTTSANAYRDQFLLMEISPLKENESDEFPAQVDFILVATPGTRFSVNWGDGTIEKRVMNGDHLSFKHTYKNVKNYTVKVSGDIGMITSYFLDYNPYLKVRDIHTGGLLNLTSIRIGGFYQSPPALNLSRNRKLESVYLFDLLQTTDIILPTTNNISLMVLLGDTALPVAVLDRIISRIYDSVRNSPRSGILNISKEADTDSEILGPPSSYSINKLKTLRDTYGWAIYPETFDR